MGYFNKLLQIFIIINPRFQPWEKCRNNKPKKPFQRFKNNTFKHLALVQQYKLKLTCRLSAADRGQEN